MSIKFSPDRLPGAEIFKAAASYLMTRQVLNIRSALLKFFAALTKVWETLPKLWKSAESAEIT